MKKKEVIFYSSIFTVISLFTLNLVFYSFTDKQLFNPSLVKVKNIVTNNQNMDQEPSSIYQGGKCSDQPKIEGLEQASDTHLRKLARYQEVCGSLAASKLMVFTDMPKDSSIAKASASKMAETLREFSKYHVQPLVVVEPVSEWGLIDFQEFGTGFYDPWIEEYFTELKAQEITDEMMGTWVPFPEANLPYWNHNNATPQDFSNVVNRYLSVLKKHYPGAKGSILLNSATYETDDFDWANGEYSSLQPYVANIQKGLVDSFGIQGFPWVPPSTISGPGVLDAREYVNSPLAIEAADILGVKEIWFNTGSFSSKYTLDSEKTVSIPAFKRKAILEGIYEEVNKAKEKGYTVWINIFAEDKSANSEATNWSYWDGDAAKPEYRIVFTEFAQKLNTNQIPFSIFDVEK